MKTVSIMLIALLLCISINAQEITLDHIDNFWVDNGQQKLIPGCPATLYLRYTNNSADTIRYFHNGYRISSDFGQAVMLYVDTIPNDIGWTERFGAYISVTFPQYNVVSFSAQAFPLQSGFEPGFSEPAFAITIGNLQQGETVCLDSIFIPPTDLWIWGNGVSPYWDGPHCFLVEVPSCPPPQFVNLPDTIYVDDCGQASSVLYYQYGCGASPVLESGHGTLTPYPPNGTGVDSLLWTWDIDAPMANNPLVVGMENYLDLCGTPGGSRFDMQSIPLVLTVAEVGDVDMSCRFDISDLLYMVDFFFSPDPPPLDTELGDCDNNGMFDIADLLSIVDYFFLPGSPPPPCVN